MGDYFMVQSSVIRPCATPALPRDDRLTHRGHRPTQEPTWLFFQCDKNATFADRLLAAHKSCAYRVAMRDLFFILFQQARAVLFETAQWPRFTGWLTS
jgi:hypothetical protein